MTLLTTITLGTELLDMNLWVEKQIVTTAWTFPHNRVEGRLHPHDRSVQLSYTEKPVHGSKPEELWHLSLIQSSSSLSSSIFPNPDVRCTFGRRWAQPVVVSSGPWLWVSFSPLVIAGFWDMLLSHGLWQWPLGSHCVASLCKVGPPALLADFPSLIFPVHSHLCSVWYGGPWEQSPANVN